MTGIEITWHMAMDFYGRICLVDTHDKKKKSAVVFPIGFADMSIESIKYINSSSKQVASRH